MKAIQFTAEEIQLLVEVLLFSSTVDVCAEWNPKHQQDMIQLAKKINDPSVKLENIYLFSTGVLEEPELTKQVTENFPNLPHSSIIED